MDSAQKCYSFEKKKTDSFKGWHKPYQIEVSHITPLYKIHSTNKEGTKIEPKTTRFGSNLDKSIIIAHNMNN